MYDKMDIHILSLAALRSAWYNPEKAQEGIL